MAVFWWIHPLECLIVGGLACRPRLHHLPDDVQDTQDDVFGVSLVPINAVRSRSGSNAIARRPG